MANLIQDRSRNPPLRKSKFPCIANPARHGASHGGMSSVPLLPKMILTMLGRRTVLVLKPADRESKQPGVRQLASVKLMDSSVGHMTKILLVEDSKFLRLATERALARAGYDMVSAADGPEALELARQQRPDLILLDMMLPKMTGPDVLKALKKDPVTKEIAVVAFTGLSQKNAVRLQQDGAFAFLDKAELSLDKGSETLLSAVAGIVKQLHLEVPVGR